MEHGNVIDLNPEALRFLCPADLPVSSGIEILCQKAASGESNGIRFVVAFLDEAAALEFIARGPAPLRPFGARSLAAFERIMNTFPKLGLEHIGLMEDGGARIYPIARIMAYFRRESN